MKLHTFKILGIILFLVGCIFILNSFSGITGFVVAESVGKGVSGILGLVLVIGGVLVFVEGREKIEERKNKEGKLIKISRSREFKSNTRRVPKKMIEGTIDKIGTGLADVHNLKKDYSGCKSINVTKSGRIVYEQSGDIIILKDYLPSHNY